MSEIDLSDESSSGGEYDPIYRMVEAEPSKFHRQQFAAYIRGFTRTSGVIYTIYYINIHGFKNPERAKLLAAELRRIQVALGGLPVIVLLVETRLDDQQPYIPELEQYTYLGMINKRVGVLAYFLTSV